MNIAIIFDTKTNTTEIAADFIREGIETTGLANAKCFDIHSVDNDFVKAADGIIIGSPTYMASITAALANWLQDSASKLNLAGKLGGAFATEKYIHGGAEIAITNILTHELVYGMMVYSSGGAFGNPTIHLGPVGLSKNIHEFKKLFNTYGARFAAQLNSIK